jgi:hypothetical protein
MSPDNAVPVMNLCKHVGKWIVRNIGEDIVALFAFDPVVEKN